MVVVAAVPERVFIETAIRRRLVCTASAFTPGIEETLAEVPRERYAMLYAFPRMIWWVSR